MQRKLYPENWEEISLAVREAAGWKCELCGIPHRTHQPTTGSLVILTVMHLDHNPQNCARENLRAACQSCHLNYDRPMHLLHAAETRRRKCFPNQTTLNFQTTAKE